MPVWSSLTREWMNAGIHSLASGQGRYEPGRSEAFREALPNRRFKVMKLRYRDVDEPYRRGADYEVRPLSFINSLHVPDDVVS